MQDWGYLFYVNAFVVTGVLSELPHPMHYKLRTELSILDIVIIAGTWNELKSNNTTVESA